MRENKKGGAISCSAVNLLKLSLIMITRRKLIVIKDVDKSLKREKVSHSYTLWLLQSKSRSNET